MKIIVASVNPIKIAAVRTGFGKMFPDGNIEVEGLEVNSGVGHQPQTDADTLRGALNRIAEAEKASPEADFWAGLEGGIEEADGEMRSFAWIAVKSREGRIGKGKTGTFFLPHAVAELVRQGHELGTADDIVFGRSNSKQANGAVGILTGDVIERAGFYSDAVVLALIPFKNGNLYN